MTRSPRPAAAAARLRGGRDKEGNGHGQATLHFEDVNEGDEAPAASHTLTRTDLVRYAGASGDYNPMHHDEIAATAAGQPSVFGHGMFSMGLLGTALTDYVGPGTSATTRCASARQTWPGEELTTKIVVTGKRVEDGRNLVDLECTPGQRRRRGQGGGRGDRRPAQQGLSRAQQPGGLPVSPSAV